MPSPSVEGRPALVLIVDDDRRNRQLLEVMLTAEGFVFQSAASGEEALLRIAEQPPDLVLLDVMMPGLDGHQVVGRLKSTAETVNIPVMIITAQDDRNARARALAAGADDFLTKPVDRVELVVRAKNLLRLKAYLDNARDDRLPDLAGSERLFRSTFESAPIGMIHADADGQWLRVNQRVCDVLGYSREQLRGPRVGDLLQSEGAAGASGVDRARYRCSDGSFVDVRVSISPLKDSGDSVERFLWVLGERST